MNNQHIEFFFCYSATMAKYFKEKANINPITTALNPASGRKFSLFIKTEQLKNLITEYEASK